MKLHASVVETLLAYVQTYGGFQNDEKLRRKIEAMDLTVYERKTGVQDMVLVSTEDYVKSLSNVQE